MSAEDIRMRIAKCRQDFKNISMQLPALIEKMEALYLPRKTTERSAESETENKPAPPAMTPDDMLAPYKELEANLRGFLKALGKREEEAGCSSQAAPPAAEDE